jgi:ferredoxin
LARPVLASEPQERRATMKVSVDADLCTGCGLCEEMCPDVFEVDDIAKVKVNPVPEAAESSCREAADGCPVDAISVES